MCWTFGETHQPLVVKPSVSCWQSVPVRSEKKCTDMQAAFLKGEFQDKDRVLCCWQPKNSPALPGVQLGSLLLILKGIFRLNDAPRKWWHKISKVLVQVGFRKQRMCLGLFTLHSSAGVLSGVTCLHVDDMLGTGDDLFDLKLKELDKLDHCGRQYEKHPNGEITISMKVYIQNLEKVCLTCERMKQLDDELSACLLCHMEYVHLLSWYRVQVAEAQDIESDQATCVADASTRKQNVDCRN